MISRDDFNTWRANPVTEWVFAALEANAEKQKQHWLETSWLQGVCAPEVLFELRTRVDAFNLFKELGYEEFCSVLEQEPKG